MKCPLFVASSAVIGVACLVGCESAEPVSFYETQAERPARRPFDREAYRKRLDHTLAAVVLRGDEAWFLKLDATAASADRLRESFVELLGSLKFGDDEEKPQWKLPEGWKEAPGDRIAAAKATTELDDKTYTATLTALPAEGEPKAIITRNVNRWLRQLGEGELSQDEAMQLARPVASADGQAYWFELVGMRKRRSAMPAGHPPVAATTSPADAAESAASQPKDAAGETPATAEGFKYVAPDGWKLGPARPNRKATFQIPTKAGPVELRVSAWPGERGRGMGSLSMNLRRWSGQVAMPTEGQAIAKLESTAEEVQVGGVAGEYVELLDGDELGMIAALVYRPQRVWFFVLQGPVEAVKEQKPQLKAFLKSIKFTDP